MFNGKDINRIIRSPKGQIALAMGDSRAMEQIARQGRDRDDEYELQRLLTQYPPQFVRPLFKVKPPREVQGNPLRYRDWILGNADPKHFNYKILQRIFARR